MVMRRRQQALPGLVLIVVLAIAVGGWAAERVLNMESKHGSSNGHVYSLEELPRPGGDVPPEPFDSYMTQIQAYGAQYPDIYAGAFLSGTDIFVGFTASPVENLRAVQKMLGPDAKLKAFKAEFSREALMQLTTTIGRDLASWRQRGIAISAVSVNEYRNRVEVMLVKVSESAVSALREAYGGILTFSAGTVMPA